MKVIAPHQREASIQPHVLHLPSIPQPFRSVLLVITLLFSLITCSPEEPKKDSTAPVISIKSPAADDQVKGTISIQATLDDEHFDKVEIYVDNVLFREETTTTLDMLWDSKTVEDGPHIIKLLAYDKEGNQAETSINFDVLNYFVTVNIPEGYIIPDRFMWIFLTDSKNNLLGIKQGANNTIMKFETPDSYKKGDRISFHRLSYVDNISVSKYETYSIYSYTGVKPGNYTYPSPSGARTSVGNHTLEISNFSSGHQTFIAGDDVGSYSLNSNGTSKVSFQLPLYKNNTDFLFVYYNPSNPDEIPAYKSITNATVGGTSAIDTKELIPYDKQSIAMPAGTSSVFHYLLGFKKAGVYQNAPLLNIFSKSGSLFSINISYPGAAFSEYMMGLSAYGSDKSMQYIKVGQVPSTFKTVNASLENFQYSNNIIKVNANGNYDFASFYGAGTKLENQISSNFDWTIYSNESHNIEYTLPQIPAEVTSKYPALKNMNIKFTQATFGDYDLIQGYDDMIKYNLQNNGLSLLAYYKEYSSVTYQLSSANNGGKHLGSEFPEGIKGLFTEMK